MTWTWRYLDGRGQACGSSRAFGSQEDAEGWLSERWARLAASGIEQVELVGEDGVAYRMSLGQE